ncbi:MAG: preprotein translocase subunit SecY [Actinomycetota bacterium]
MLSAFRNAFKVPDLRKKILFTLGVLAVYRLGCHIPTPGADYSAIQQAIEQTGSDQQGIYTLINLFSGGALTQFAIFALGIMPAITSQIIMQLLTVVIPKLEAWQKEGEAGYKKIQQWTRYLTVTLALMQSTAMTVMANRGQLVQGIKIIPDRNFTPPRIALTVLSLTAGTALIMWMGELITQRGIGNGMSLIIFASIIARLPVEGSTILSVNGLPLFIFVLLLGFGIIVAVVLVEQAQRRIPVQYAKRMVGRRMYGGTSTYIPLKVNQAGVIPIIFASSLLYLPALAASIVRWDWLQKFVNSTFAKGSGPVYIISYFVLIIFFAYFYTAITFNPLDVADNMKKYGGFIPGIRPGRPTAEYLDHILTRITLPGSLFLGSIAILPFLALAAWGINSFPFGGTAILIVVGVALETMKQIDSQLLMRNYEGFLR